MDQSFHSSQSLVYRPRFYSPSPPKISRQSYFKAGLGYSAGRKGGVGGDFEHRTREGEQLRGESGVYLMLVSGKVVGKGKERRLVEGFGCLKSRLSLYDLTIKRKLDVSFLRRSALTLNQALTLPYLRLLRPFFRAIQKANRPLPVSPLPNYSKGLSKLHHSLLRDSRSAHYRSVSSKSLSLTLVRDFTINVLDKVVAAARSRAKAWAWNRVRYLVVTVRTEGSQGVEKRGSMGVERNSKREARLALALSKLQPAYLLRKYSFSHWKSLFLAYCRQKLIEAKVGLAVQQLFPFIRAKITGGFRKIEIWGKEKGRKGGQLQTVLLKTATKLTFSSVFKQIHSHSALKARQFRALSRAFKLIGSKERLQTAGRIQRLYMKLAECTVEGKRRTLKVQKAARGLGIALRGLVKERLQAAFQHTQAYFPCKAQPVPAVPSLYPATRLAKAFNCLHSAFKRTLRSSLQCWKAHYLAIPVKDYKQFSQYRSNRGSMSTTRPQTLASQREIPRKRPDSSSPEYHSSMQLVSELLRSQYGIQTRVEAMLRQSHSPLRSNLALAKEKVRGVLMGKVLGGLLGMKWAFERLGRVREWPVDRGRKGLKSALHIPRSLPSASFHSLHLLDAQLKHRLRLQALSTWKLQSQRLTASMRRRGKVLGSALDSAIKRVHKGYQRSALLYLQSYPPSYLDVLSALATVRRAARSYHRTALTQALQYPLHRLWKTQCGQKRGERRHHRYVYSTEITRSSISRCVSPIEERTYRVVLPAPASIHQYIDDVVEVAKTSNVEASYSSKWSSMGGRGPSPTQQLLRTELTQGRHKSPRTRSHNSFTRLQRQQESRCKNCGRKKRSQASSHFGYVRPSTGEDLEYYLSAH